MYLVDAVDVFRGAYTSDGFCTVRLRREREYLSTDHDIGKQLSDLQQHRCEEGENHKAARRKYQVRNLYCDV